MGDINDVENTNHVSTNPGMTTPDEAADAGDEDGETDSTLPDGGYGWVIIFASFMCHFISDGIAFSFGFLYADLLEQFGESKAKTAWVGSLFVGVPLLCAPIAGFFVNKYGCRPATLFGAGLTSVALAVSSLATSIDMLCVTFGVAAGLGLAFIYVPASVIPSFWFEKKRALATGIAVSGSGVGTFVMAPLMEYLIKEFNWRGSLLITSGIAMHMLVFGALFREYVPEMVVSNSRKTRMLQARIIECELLSSGSSSEENLTHSDDNISYKPQSCKMQLFGDAELLNIRVERKSQSLDLRQTFQRNPTKCGRSLLPASRMDISSVLTLAEERERIPRYGSCPAVLQLTPRSNDFVRKQGVWWKILHQAKQGCGLTLLAVPVYLLYFMSSFLLSFAYDYPYIYLPDYAQQLGIAKSSFLISIIGIVNTIGQVVYGFVGDIKKVDIITLYGGSSMVCGVAILLIPSLSTYGWLATFSALFGFFISASFSLETVVVINILSLDELTKAYSLLLFGQGVASLIGPPVGGSLWDLTESYSATFYLAGTTMVMSGLLSLLILAVRRKKRSRTSSASSDVSE